MKSRPQQDQSFLERNGSWLVLGVVLAVVFWAARGINISFGKLLSGFSAVTNIVSLMFPPDLSYFNRTIMRMVQSIHISFLGTLIGSILAIPVSFIAANNLLV